MHDDQIQKILLEIAGKLECQGIDTGYSVIYARNGEFALAFDELHWSMKSVDRVFDNAQIDALSRIKAAFGSDYMGEF